MKDLFNQLCQAVHELHSQETSTHTVHQILFGLKHCIPLSSAILALKNPKTDYIEIKNRYNVSEQCLKTFKRGVGKHLVNRLFYKDMIAIASIDGDTDDYEDLSLECEYNTAVAMRIEMEGRPFGYLALYFDKPFDLSAETRSFLLAIAKLCAESLTKEHVTNKLAELRRLDPQTGLLYFGFFHQKMKEELLKCKRHNYPLSVALMDMDNYKDVMNLFGIDAAHKLYSEVAEELKATLRGIDVVGHYGTDQIILYLPNTTLENALVVIGRFMEQVSGTAHTDKNIMTSLSVGLTSAKPESTVDDLVSAAQVALYNARISGKGLIKTFT